VALGCLTGDSKCRCVELNGGLAHALSIPVCGGGGREAQAIASRGEQRLDALGGEGSEPVGPGSFAARDQWRPCDVGQEGRGGVGPADDQPVRGELLVPGAVVDVVVLTRREQVGDGVPAQRGGTDQLGRGGGRRGRFFGQDAVEVASAPVELIELVASGASSGVTSVICGATPMPRTWPAMSRASS
jgi:hypothetical protein